MLYYENFSGKTVYRKFSGKNLDVSRLNEAIISVTFENLWLLKNFNADRTCVFQIKHAKSIRKSRQTCW